MEGRGGLATLLSVRERFEKKSKKKGVLGKATSIN